MSFQTDVKKTKSAILVLAHLMDKKGVLGKETLARIKRALKAFEEKKANFIITTGWDYRNDCSYKIGEVIANYIRDNYNIDNDKILTDVKARDTVGDAFFVMKNILIPQNIKQLIVVTSYYHQQRTQFIFDSFMGHFIDVEVTGVDVDLSNQQEIIEHEKKSTLAFRKTFNNVDLTSQSEIFIALKANHPFYNGTIYDKVD